MVTKKEYLNEEELVELIALNSVLPGPTSTQTIVSIGYKTGGTSIGIFNNVSLGATCSYNDDSTVIFISSFGEHEYIPGWIKIH